MGDGPFKEYFHTLHPAGSVKTGPYIYHADSECPEDRGGNGGCGLYGLSHSDTTLVLGYTH